MFKLEIKNISKSFNNIKILENINIHLKEKETVCLLGESGIGKSTLFNIIAGTLNTDIGKIYLNNNDITGKTGHISYMQQKDLLLPYRKIIYNVAIPLIIRGENKKIAMKKASSFFKEFGLLGTENKYPWQISGGMRQRVALLRTYLFSSQIFLLDEPFSALDSINKHRLQNWYLSIASNMNLSTLIITHDIDEAITLSNKIYIMSGKPATITAEIIIDRNTLNNQNHFNYKETILKLII